MRELVEYLVRALVEDPDAVQVEELEENGDVVLGDRRRGRSRSRDRARRKDRQRDRTVARAAATKEERRVLVEILE